MNHLNLPDNLQIYYCYNNKKTKIQNLPVSLQIFNCFNNNIPLNHDSLLNNANCDSINSDRTIFHTDNNPDSNNDMINC